MTRLALWMALGAGCDCSGTRSHPRGDDASVPDAASDAAPDAGDAAPPGPVVHDCIEALAAEPGRACDFSGWCQAADLCCSAFANCVATDHLENVSAPTLEDCLAPDTPTECVAIEGASGLAGTAPGGDVDLSYAHASFSFAFSVDLIVVFTDEAALSTCSTPRMSFYLFPAGDSYTGTHDALGQLVTDTAVVWVPATVEVTADDGDGTIAGTILVDADGWSLTGDFSLTSCADVDRSSP